MSASNCSCTCPTPETVLVPGTEGAAGGAGAAGAAAFTTTSGGHTLPVGTFDKSASVVFSVASAASLFIGQHIAVEDVGNTNASPGYFQITGIVGAQITATYINTPANYNAASVLTGKAVTPSGPPYTVGTKPDAFTDNSTGVASSTIAAGAGVFTLAISVSLAQITGAMDVLTTYTPGFAFKVLTVDAVVKSAVTTAAKAATINLEIGTTNLTGGNVALTSANCTPLGNKIAGSTVTGNNTGTSSDTLSVEAASVTAFVEGEVILLIKIQNMDTANAIASLASALNTLRNTTLA